LNRFESLGFLLRSLLVLLGVILSGCVAPIGADKTLPSLAYRQIHDNPVSRGQPSPETKSALHRFEQVERFEFSPEETLKRIQQKAVETRERGLLFVLSELNYLVAERVRQSVKPWEPRDARDYYLASAVSAWLFLFADAAQAPPDAFDQRFRTACDLYNYGLGWALTARRSTNAIAQLAGGSRHLPLGQVEIEFQSSSFPWTLSDFDHFALADHFVVRGLSVRNRQPGLGAALAGVTKAGGSNKLSRAVPATALLRIEGGLSELALGRMRASLEVYSPFDESEVKIGGRSVPLETDLTIATAYRLNESYIWGLGMQQFFSAEEKVPTDVYLAQPFRPDRIPVVFVHGTFSSPVWWAEMANTLAADPVVRRHYQFWYFIYNSGYPTATSAQKLRAALKARVRELDPSGRDAALQQMVVIGHSQGGLLTKLTATDTGDTLLRAVVKTNRLGEVKVPPKAMADLRRYTVYDSLPFVKRVVFISTPHRGSYAAGGFVRNLARKLVSLPSTAVRQIAEYARLVERLEIPKELRGRRTSLDSMSPKNPLLKPLADIPLAPGVKGHSIIAVQGNGDYREGKDGLVSYDSAHLDYVESEFIVRGFHSCQDKPPTIEEVLRILHEHLKSLPADVVK
jgi:pimeloyl-ACP methyl ester carboxylesterase